MISVILKGRIGNQLFIYAFADALRKQRGLPDEEIEVYDYEVLNKRWINSLEDYSLDNISYLHNKYPKRIIPFIQYVVLKLFYKLGQNKSYSELYAYEQKYQQCLNKLGIIACENGFINYNILGRKNIMIMGYFQSPQYFDSFKESVISPFRLNDIIDKVEYKGLETIKNRESVCISIKVEHNIGSYLYDVCTKDYWKEAIDYIVSKVDSPLFFICSDNVQYVLDHLIDTDKFEYICQEKEQPVSISLAVMGLCKHFIIGNTSFGWWAQKLSDNPDKIVIAPKPWMKVNMPIDIYEKDWKIIDV